MADASVKSQATEEEVTPQHRHRQKLAETESARKKRKPKTIERWLEVVPEGDPNRALVKGRKVRICSRVQHIDGTGRVVGSAVHRLYLGREKQVKEQLERYRKDGLQTRVAG